jgi:hypothetical protein
MRQFKEPEDIEFYKQNSIYDINTDLRRELIILELDKVMADYNRYHRTLIHENNSLSTIIPYRILKYYKSNNLKRGYYSHDDSDLIGYTSELRIDVIDGVTCILIKLDEKAIASIKSQLEDDDEFDFTLLGKCSLHPGDVLSGGIDTRYLTSVDCIFFNIRKKGDV